MLKLTNDPRNVHLNDIATNIHQNGKISKVSNAKCWHGCAEMGTPVQPLQKYKLIQPF